MELASDLETVFTRIRCRRLVIEMRRGDARYDFALSLQIHPDETL
jgi:hypothetical protein